MIIGRSVTQGNPGDAVGDDIIQVLLGFCQISVIILSAITILLKNF